MNTSAPAPAPAAAPPDQKAEGANWWDKYESLADSGQGASSGGADEGVIGTAENFGMGLARGAKDVIDTGAKLLSSGFDKIAGTNEGERVQQMNEAGKADFERDYGDSTAASLGRVGGQVAATLPASVALGGAATLAGAARLGSAIASGGFRTGQALEGAGLAARAADMGIRAAGGAISGGAAAGLVSPESAVEGAAIGAALPGVVGVAGTSFQRLGQAMRGASIPAGVRRAAQAGTEAGYVIPPTQVNPSFTNRMLEGVAGKTSVAQNASMRNQGKTNTLARRALGLSDDVELNIDTLENLRRGAGQAYAPVAAAGTIIPERAYFDALDKALEPFKNRAASFPGAKVPSVVADIEALKAQQFDSGAALEMIKSLRESSNIAYRAGEKTAGESYKAGANALEDAIENHLKGMGQPAADILKNFRDSRTLIAKSYSVQDALNPTTGTVNAVKLGAALNKGKPLSGELKQIAEFANAFPTAAKVPERMGSLPQTSPLDWTAAGVTAATTGAGLPAAATLAARPAARAAALSGPVQRGLAAKAAEQPSQAAINFRNYLGRLGALSPASAVVLTNRDQ